MVVTIFYLRKKASPSNTLLLVFGFTCTISVIVCDCKWRNASVDNHGASARSPPPERIEQGVPGAYQGGRGHDMRRCDGPMCTPNTPLSRMFHQSTYTSFGPQFGIGHHTSLATTSFCVALAFDLGDIISPFWLLFTM